MDSVKQTTHSTSSDMVYSPIPDWVSGSPDYSTGGALADLNNDGWLDLVVSDGNDMSQGHVRVYLNDGNGHLSTEASWQSADVAYNGHLDIADINGDGWPDVAVSYLGTVQGAFAVGCAEDVTKQVLFSGRQFLFFTMLKGAVFN